MLFIDELAALTPAIVTGVSFLDPARLTRLIASDVPPGQARIMGVDLDAAGTRALVAVRYDPDSAAYESVVSLHRADSQWVVTNEGFGFGGGHSLFPGLGDDAERVAVPYLVAQVSTMPRVRLC